MTNNSYSNQILQEMHEGGIQARDESFGVQKIDYSLIISLQGKSAESKLVNA